jgi:hypothetical protein
MGPCFHHRRRRPALLLLVATAVLTAFLAASAQVASAGEPPCPSCPSKMPPPGTSPGNGGGGAGTGGATKPVLPLISLGSISVGGGTVSVAGVVNVSVPNVSVTVNAAPISIGVNGSFSATVKLDAGAAIVIKAGDRSNGQTNKITIPASAVPSGGVAADALVQLEADAVTLMLPPDGLTIVDGVDISARVRVKAIVGIAGLKLNRVDLLAKLRIGSSAGSSGSGSQSGNPGTTTPPASTNPPCHHTATAKVAGNAKKVALTVTATNGASQTTTVPVKRVRSVIKIGRLRSVSAFGARGIRITAVRFDTSLLARTHRVIVTVSVRDRRNYLVRDAVVMLQPTPHHASIGGALVGMSNTLGRARFSISVKGSSLGHRLYLTALARTPLASTRVVKSVLLCTCAG